MNMEKVEAARVKEERPKKKKNRIFIPCCNSLLKWDFNSLKKNYWGASAC